MNEKYESILSALKALRIDSMQCENTKKGINELIDKYNLLFLGAKFNIIYSTELCGTLKTKFGIQIELDDLNQMIPTLCKTLNMNFEPMNELSDLLNSKPFAYQITLY